MPIDQIELARRLRGARELAGITQDQAATAVGIPRPSIVQIESGKRAVSGLELDRLAVLYRKDVRLLLEVSPDADATVTHFRIDEELIEQPELREALAECLRYGRELAHLEQLTGLDRTSLGTIRYDLAAPSVTSAAVSQGSRTAEAERRRLGLADGPVDDLIEVLEGAGIRTAILDMPDAISGVMFAEPGAAPLVVANRTHHVGRRTFSFAHEYAHALLDRDERALVSRTGESGAREVRANAFAAGFLMPESGIRRRLAEYGKAPSRSSTTAGEAETLADRASVRLHDVVYLANEFKVTRPAVLVRLRTLRILTQRQADTLAEEDSRSGQATASLLGLRGPDHRDERERSRRRFARLAFEAFSRGEISEAQFQTYLVRDVGMDVAEVKAAFAAARASSSR